MIWCRWKHPICECLSDGISECYGFVEWRCLFPLLLGWDAPKLKAIHLPFVKVCWTRPTCIAVWMFNIQECEMNSRTFTCAWVWLCIRSVTLSPRLSVLRAWLASSHYSKYDVHEHRTDGRVLVNTNHSADEDDIFLAPQIARVAKPHQVSWELCCITELFVG